MDENPGTENEVPETANDHKERGNECIKAGNFSEAILHYSFAIKLNPNEATFYSNRSLAFLKLDQLYYANEDADRAIQLKPDWAKVRGKCLDGLIAVCNGFVNAYLFFSMISGLFSKS